MLKLIYQIIGFLMILVGIPLFFMPIPFGAILIATGTFILVGSSSAFAGFIRKCRHKFPKFNRFFEIISSKMPRAVQRQLAKTDPRLTGSD